MLYVWVLRLTDKKIVLKTISLNNQNMTPIGEPLRSSAHRDLLELSSTLFNVRVKEFRSVITLKCFP